MKTLKDIKYTTGLKVLVRVDFNVSIKDGIVTEDYRIRMALPTIKYLLEKGSTVILISHLEANDGVNPSLRPIAECLNRLGTEVTFIENYKNAFNIINNESHDSGSDDVKNKCFLMENLRFFEGEKSNDKQFAKELASLADVYVNEAFSVCHRKHASIVGVPEYLDSYAGLQLESEITNLSKAFNPNRPFLFILGGAKFDTKLPLLEKFMKIADYVFVGGALANNLLREKGYEIGKSTVSEGDFGLKKFIADPKLLIPIDILNQSNDSKNANEVLPDDIILDIGSKTLEQIQEVVDKSKFILWNGPMGKYEGGFQKSTLELAKMIGDATLKSRNESDQSIESILGGGDTLTAIETLNIESKFTFVSTGGGAMLDFLANGSLPGIDAIKTSKV